MSEEAESDRTDPAAGPGPSHESPWQELDVALPVWDRFFMPSPLVVAARVHRDPTRGSDENDDALLRRAPLLAYLHPGRFAQVRESKPYPFPSDFRR